MKNNNIKNKSQKRIFKHKVEFWPMAPTDPWYNMLQTLEIRKKYWWQEIVTGTPSHGNELENNLVSLLGSFFMFWFRVYLTRLSYKRSFKPLFPDGTTTFTLVVLKVPYHYTDHSLLVLHKQSWNSEAFWIRRFEFSN